MKALIDPMAGQSFNPSAKAHKGVLDKVFKEEKTEIETAKALSLKNQSIIAKAPSDNEESSEPSDDDKEYSSDSDLPEGVYKPDSLKKKTKQDRHRQVGLSRPFWLIILESP